MKGYITAYSEEITNDYGDNWNITPDQKSVRKPKAILYSAVI